MKWFRRILLSIGVLVAVALVLGAHYYYRGFYRPVKARVIANEEDQRLVEKAGLHKAWLSRHGFNSEICFLVDMRLPSGKDRFFVYDLRKDSVLLAGMVAHGRGDKSFSFTPSFSNINGSSCTSLGRYRIGSHYQGQFGLAYRLYGLDSTNDQALTRNVVLHGFTGVPKSETYPYPICNSRGCPMVSPVFLQQLQPFIDRSKQPVMLCIFN